MRCVLLFLMTSGEAQRLLVKIEQLVVSMKTFNLILILLFTQVGTLTLETFLDIVLNVLVSSLKSLLNTHKENSYLYFLKPCQLFILSCPIRHPEQDNQKGLEK